MFVDHFDWEVPLYQVVDDVMRLYVRHDLRGARACASLIARVTAEPWLAATVTGPMGAIATRRFETTTSALFTRVVPHLPPRMFGEALHSLHPSLRVYRYHVGQQFGAHSDQPYFDADGRQSRLTLLVYLDAVCVGGETAFLEIERPAGVVVTPRVGRALFFQQSLLHEGRPVTEGIKHVLRTDVIYAPD